MELVSLEEYVRDQLELHRKVLTIVKKYVDSLLSEVFEIDPNELRSKDPATYYAIAMELARSIFINYSVEKRTHKQVHQKQPHHTS